MSKNDCLRQCVARIIDRDPDTVPHFVGLYRGRWVWHLERWLSRRGFGMVLAPTTPSRRVHGSLRLRRWIEIGTTRRGTCHAVVRSHTGRVVYDGGNPLRRVTRILLIVRFR